MDLKNHNKVIFFPEPREWAFHDFCHMDGTSAIEEWLESEGDDVWVSFNTLMKGLKRTADHHEWIGFRGFLEGKKYRDQRIWEIGFRVPGSNVQYRLLGKFDGQRQVILLCGCYHKQQRYTPAKALDTACKRAKALSEGKGRLCVRQIQNDV